MELLTISAVAVAIVAALRSSWSPCGVSMLSSITPLSESARGHRYWATITWFLLGSILGGASLGVVAALGALVVGAVGFSALASALLVFLVGCTTIASDLGVGGFRLPANPRQVNRFWLDQYRPWVYGLGFGWQLGVGVATYVMTASVYLMVVVAASTGEPLLAMGIVTFFGLLRGLAILPAARIRIPADLSTLHRGIERFRPASRLVAIIAQIGVVAAAVAVAAAPAVGLVSGASLLAITWTMRGGLHDPAPPRRRSVYQPAPALIPLSDRPS